MKKNFKNLNLAYIENVIDLKNKRAVQFTYLVLTIIALTFFGLFAINPTLSTIAKLQKEIEHYAKRQMTWFKRDKRIKWIENYQKARYLLTRFVGML